MRMYGISGFPLFQKDISPPSKFCILNKKYRDIKILGKDGWMEAYISIILVKEEISRPFYKPI